jgi:hypothetical protein
MLYPYTISTSDSFVQIDSRVTTANVLINLSTSALSSGNITIRDIGGNTSFFNTSSIQVSTLNNSLYNDTTSSQVILKPYGSLTINGNIRPNTWLIQNEYDNLTKGTAYGISILSSFTLSSLYTSSITGLGSVSTVNINVSTQAILSGSTIATTAYWSTAIYNLPTSGPGFGYVASSLLSTNVYTMASDYKYISSSWLASLNNQLASAFQLVSSLTYTSTLSSITPDTYGYISTIVIGRKNGFVQYAGGYNVGSISTSGNCILVEPPATVTYGAYTTTFSNTFQAKNITTGNLKFNTIISPSFNGLYNTVTLLNTSVGSDRSIKKDILPITNAVSKLRSIRGVSYKMKGDDTVHLGFIAQEVEEILPELVITSENGKAMYYGDIVGLLIEGVKELISRLDALEPYFICDP